MDKLVVHLDLLYLRLEMTAASFVIVQALSMCCRIQLCMIHGGVPAIFSVLESSEVKFPALEGFVLPTYFPSRLGNLTKFFPTALCLSNASSNHLSERISIHTDCTSVTTVYNYIVQPCVSPNASSNCLPRRCIITLIASFDVFIDKSFKTKYFTKCPSHENYFRLMLHILKRCILSTPG